MFSIPNTCSLILYFRPRYCTTTLIRLTRQDSSALDFYVGVVRQSLDGNATEPVSQLKLYRYRTVPITHVLHGLTSPQY